MAILNRLPCLILCVLLGGILPARLEAVTYSAVSSGEVERLVLTFPSGVPAFAVSRTGEREVILRFDETTWAREKRPADSEVKGRLIRFLHHVTGGVRVTMADNAFGYVAEEGPGANQLQLTVFVDSMGSQWTAADRTQVALRQPRPLDAPEPDQSPRPDGGQSSPAKVVTAKPTDNAAPAASKPVEKIPAATAEAPALPEPAIVSAKQAGPASATETASIAPERPQAKAQATDSTVPTAGRPFFSVPYSLRAPIRSVGPEEATTYSTTPVIGQGPKVAMNIAPVRGQAKQPEASAGSTAAAPAVPAPSAPPAPSSLKDAPAPQAVPAAGQPGKETKPAVQASPVPQASSTAPEGQTAKPVTEPASGTEQAEGVANDKTAATAAKDTDDTGPVDEKGKPILTHEELYQVAVRHFINSEYKEAIEVYKQLRANPEVKGNMREEVLHNLAQASYNLYRDTLRDHFHEVVGALEAAINFKPDSEKVPQALLQLGLAHLRVDNIPEASAYFKILTDKYPQDLNVPYIDFYWGDYYYRKGKYREAADAYQVVVQDHPDSPIIRDASLGLARSLEKLEYYEQAYQIVDFIDKRWPRFYIEDPEFLRLSGELANRLQKFGEAKDDLWNYYNMQPAATGNDVILARIGDIYLRAGQRNAARDIYRTVAARYPEDEGGLVAKMRLAEEGIYDSPTLDQMYKVFDRPFNLRPEEIYTQIVRKYPKSALAPLAQLKLSMWHLFSNRYLDTLADVNTMLRLFPSSELTPKALDVGLKAFEQNARHMAQEENFARIVDTWDRYPFLAKRGDSLSPQTRLLVATSMSSVGRPGDALEIAKPLLAGAMQGESSQGAMMLAVHIYLEEEAWGQIEAMSKVVEKWNLPPERRRQFDFSLALALENLGKPELSLPIWTKLAADMQLETEQRGYALYYMSRAAAQKEDFRNQYLYSHEALNLFLQSGRDKEKVKDCLLSLVEVCRKVNQLEQALHWALEYDKRITDADPEWPASRFRLAEIHRGLGNDGEWRRNLNELIKKKPDSLFGRMAASTFESMALERKVDRYRPEIDEAAGR
ncbi:tetratricopeptide repeat protein [Desulfocurvibacter africanus]|uniref:Tetratricopeptide domain-containing protein n=1 Tax=Desulfocurvibacter africanus subsp. africanus str. Walvis Bay TaxID=690850 RepID=F3Z002_DESAF|nr:tetratricopeptide repeat protein [Desulfocurvibacter africanus]EGJ52031.1 tetratricopeptide domain-containing protein [Desulfocurvibacter africanus subsp. africanus str. Walvis Bay]